MCDKAVFNDSLMLKYCLDRYKTQEISDNAFDALLSALKFVPGWFVTNEIEKLMNYFIF